MSRKIKCIMLILLAATVLCGCMRTVDQMYYPPRRSEDHSSLQSAIDGAMSELEYSAPLSGENQQAVQNADLDGDGIQEYLVFAKGSSELPLRILVFRQTDDTFSHVQTIESAGTAFEQVEYADMDGHGGVEIVVGSQLADQVVRSVSVYSFTDSMSVTTLLTTGSSKFITVDLDRDGMTELFVLRPGQTEADNGIAELYGMENGILERSNEVNMSESVGNLKRIIVGKLYDGKSAVYVASAVEDTMLITDVYAWLSGTLTNVSFSHEAGTSVKTMRNYYVYADDIDNDGVVELPYLITMMPMADGTSAERHDLIRWYAMKSDGTEVDKMFTFHNFVGGWYLELNEEWASRLTVLQQGNNYEFYLWNQRFTQTQKIFTITALSGHNRTEQPTDGQFVVYSNDSVTYWATLQEGAAYYGITQQLITQRFHLIQRDWKTGET